MRSFSWFVAAAGLALAASQASAQCYYVAPPTAPDMRNPGYYYQNCYGVIYGPNYFVQPPFPPYQGAIIGPPKARAAAALAPYAENPEAFQKAMDVYHKSQSFGGFPRHLYARSPRDFFMYDVGPAPSGYNYGYAGYGAEQGGGSGAWQGGYGDGQGGGQQGGLGGEQGGGQGGKQGGQGGKQGGQGGKQGGQGNKQGGQDN